MEERKKAQEKGHKLLPFRLITTLSGEPIVAVEKDVDSDYGVDNALLRQSNTDMMTDGCLASGSQQSRSAQEVLAASGNEGNSHEITSKSQKSQKRKSGQVYSVNKRVLRSGGPRTR